MSVRLILLAVGLSASSGVPGLFMARASKAGQRSATVLSITASLVGLAGVLLSLAGRAGSPVDLPWAVPGGAFAVGVDGLSALFLVPLFLVSGLGAVFGEGYWPAERHPETGPRLRFFYGFVTAAIAMVFVARNTILFLASWEVMALSAYFLVATEDRKREVREASWIYLVATHTATLALFALLALLRSAAGTFTFSEVARGVAGGQLGRAIFALALFAFGIKAGLLPLHVWLPGAHAAAPSHVSALMSGVLIKTGIYGLFRVTSLFPDPPLWWGGTLVALGALSGILGVAFALGQHDLKRLLAYHSVENIGIITMGLGLGLVGRSVARPEWVVLGFAGGLLHVVNHGLFKSLLFYGAGSVHHATGTREMDRLGGLGKRMPRTALFFLVGAVAICGLPPLNGFVSEWLIYLGLLGTLRGAATPWIWGTFAVPALALIGALAVACFVKAFGVVFLGVPRSDSGKDAHESSSLTFPMATLSAACLVIGLAPVLVAPLVVSAIAPLAPRLDLPALGSLAPLGALGAFACAVAALLAVVALVGGRRTSGIAAAVPTWDCGYAAPRATMQYTSSSFATWAVAFFRWALVPAVEAPQIVRPFERFARFESHVPDTVLDRFLRPAFRAGAWLVSWGRFFQQGRIQLYLVYVAVTLVVLLFRV